MFNQDSITSGYETYREMICFVKVRLFASHDGDGFEALLLLASSEGHSQPGSMSSGNNSVTICPSSRTSAWVKPKQRIHHSVQLNWTAPSGIDGCVTLTSNFLSGDLWHQKVTRICRYKGCFHNITSSHGVLDTLTERNRLRNCTENIVFLQTKPGNRIHLQFQSVRLASSKLPKCNKEWIEVFHRSNMSVGTKFCGALDSRKVGRLFFHSEDNLMFIRTKVASRNSSFTAVYYVLDRRKGCNGTVNSSSGVITSPNYPGPYFPSLDCYVKVPVPSGARAIIQIERLHIQKELTDTSCSSDFLEISSGAGVLRRLCGSLEDLRYSQLTVLTSQETLVHFHSDSYVEGQGFRLDYAITTECGRDIYTEPNGTFVLGHNQGGSRCFKIIHLPFDHVVDLNVSTTKNYFSSGCSKLALEVLEKESSSLLCNLSTASWAGFRSKGNSVLLRIKRDDSWDMPDLIVNYRAVSPDQSSVTASCEYGWAGGETHCYFLQVQSMSWTDASLECHTRGGHLASVPNQETQGLLERVIDDSLLQSEDVAVWIGGNDRVYENYYEWEDGRPFGYTNWFKGWPEHGFYSWQPSDDGLSDQDCVEMRRIFRFPAKGSGRTRQFFWNDRDCKVSNPFICQKLRPGVKTITYPPNCNRTVMLSVMKPRDIITSPAFPDPYPNNIECFISIKAPVGFKIVVTFASLLLEDGKSCSYDYIRILEDGEESMKVCGDWSNRLKLLRHESSLNKMTLKFVSDFSHSYAGFMANVTIEEGGHLCEDERLLSFGNHCYLFVTYPQVTWKTASTICAEMKGHLASISSEEEHAFVEEHARQRATTTAVATYWLGGIKKPDSSHWSWTDSSPFTVYAWYPNNDNRHADQFPSEDSDKEKCMNARFVTTTPEEMGGKKERSHLYWFGIECERFGGYVCKINDNVSPKVLNVTIRGEKGTLTSPGNPKFYASNLDYVWVIAGPPDTKILLEITKMDMEWQQDCLYDYLGLQSTWNEVVTRYCGSPFLNSEKIWSLEYTSQENVLHVTFHSDYSVAGTGFSATWKAVDVSGCPHKTLQSEKGVLTSPNFPDPYLTSLDCETVITVADNEIALLQFDILEVGPYDNRNPSPGGFCLERTNTEAGVVFLGLGDGANDEVTLCGNLTHEIANLAFASVGKPMKLRLRSASSARFKGFKANFHIENSTDVQRMVFLMPNATGPLYSLNYPLERPPGIVYTRKLIVPLGYAIELRLIGFSSKLHAVDSDRSSCEGWHIQVMDPYLQEESPIAVVCKTDNATGDEEYIVKSYYNILHVRESGYFIPRSGSLENQYITYLDDEFVNKTLSNYTVINSCSPNPCINNGECVSVGDTHSCKCKGYYAGMFCHLTVCDISNPCIHGQCSLSNSSKSPYNCICSSGYIGKLCKDRQNPCDPNPCGSRGSCLTKNDTFECRCFIWWQGPSCEQRYYKIPFRPLSQRMLEEPFWLGLITVSVVLLVISCVWCIKRKFADKLERFLAEEIERRSSSAGKSARGYIGSKEQASPISTSPQASRSILSRIGLRKHSMLSLDSTVSGSGGGGGSSGSPSYHENRSFSFDDMLRRGGEAAKPSEENFGCVGQAPATASIASKQELLKSLVTPAAQPKERRMSLDEFIQLSEMKLQERKSSKEEELRSTTPSPTPTAQSAAGLAEETSFSSAVAAATAANPSNHRRALLRKRVSFARMLEKIDSVSFDYDANKEEPATAAVQQMATNGYNNGVAEPPGDAEVACSETGPSLLRQPRLEPSDSSSMDADSSWASSDVPSTTHAEVHVEVHEVPGAPNPATNNNSEPSSESGVSGTSSLNTSRQPVQIIVQGSTPDHSYMGYTTESSDTAAVQSDCDTLPLPSLSSSSSSSSSSTSSSSSSSSTSSSASSSSLSLSLASSSSSPSPTPPPALTHKSDSSPTTMLSPVTLTSDLQCDKSPESVATTPSVVILMQDPNIDNCLFHHSISDKIPVPLFQPIVKPSMESSLLECLDNRDFLAKPRAMSPFEPANPKLNGLLDCKLSVPMEKFSNSLAVPTFSMVEIPSGVYPKTHDNPHVDMEPVFHKRLPQFDKRGSLDLPTPIITITGNPSSSESDTDSPTKCQVGMCYLSPFDVMRVAAERSTSLSNLSSSGYSSMASPGPSRCNSNSPLFNVETDAESSNGYSNGYSTRLQPPASPTSKLVRHLSPTNVKSNFLAVPAINMPHQSTMTTSMATLGLTGLGSSPKCRSRPPLLRAVSMHRRKSDSETTTDEHPEATPFAEDSNDDEGIGMDSGVYLTVPTVDPQEESCKDTTPPVTVTMDSGPSIVVDENAEDGSCHNAGWVKGNTCPAIIVQAILQNEVDKDKYWKYPRRRSFQRKLSPVSSRSESPLSDRGLSPSTDRYSPQFCGDDSTSAFAPDSDDGLCERPRNESPLLSPSVPLVPPEARPPSVVQPRKVHRRCGDRSSRLSPSRQMLEVDRVIPRYPRRKLSPKRRFRIQNSVDADSSSSDSSCTAMDCRLPLVPKMASSRLHLDVQPPFRRKPTTATGPKDQSVPVAGSLATTKTNRTPRGGERTRAKYAVATVQVRTDVSSSESGSEATDPMRESEDGETQESSPSASG